MKALLKAYLPRGIWRFIATIYYGAKAVLYHVRALFSLRMVVHGVRFRRPFLAGVAVSEHIRITEPWMGELLSRLPVREKAFIDVGVNVGQTLLSMKAAYPAWEYVGFEPNPACIFYVEELIRKNNLTSTRVVPVGLSNKEGIADLWVTRGRPVSSGSTLEKDFKLLSLSKRRARFVALCRLDDIWQEIAHVEPGVIKIDTEGHEPQVLEGALETIKKYRPCILVELLPPRTLGDDEHRARIAIRDSLQRIVDDLGYSLFSIETSNEGALRGLRAIPAFPSAVVQKKDSGYCRDYLLSSDDRAVSDLLL